MKPHLCYATEIRSPAQKSLKFEVEQVQKPVTRWILSLKTGQMSYGERLLVLDMHAASYLLWRNQGSHFLSHIQYWYIDIDITYYVTFNDHPRRDRGQSAGCYSYCSGLWDFSSFIFCSHCKTVEQNMQRRFIYLEVLPPLAV